MNLGLFDAYWTLTLTRTTSECVAYFRDSTSDCVTTATVIALLPEDSGITLCDESRDEETGHPPATVMVSMQTSEGRYRARILCDDCAAVCHKIPRAVLMWVSARLDE